VDRLTNLRARELQRCLAQEDVEPSYQSFKPGVSHALVIRIDRLKLKMYQERGHPLPHLHIDYGKEHHIASYSIDPTRRLDGSLARKYDSAITTWIGQHKVMLIDLWNRLQDGDHPEIVIAELQGIGA